MLTSNVSAVIPAKAGIHVDLLFRTGSNNRIKMDPSFRWDDDQEHPS